LNNLEKFADTDLCVKCGLCLPHCPTYRKTLDENESPRGRLALIQGWAGNQLEATPKLLQHIDRCLLCRSCEAVCPANVPYGRLVDQFREDAGGADKPTTARTKVAAFRALLQSPRLSRAAGAVLRGYQNSWLQALIGRSGLLAFLGWQELEAGLPEMVAASYREAFYPAHGAEVARVGLFLGCTGQLFDRVTVAAAIRVLTRLGVSVVVPERQGCCGALDLHAGDGAAAVSLAERNARAFDGAAVDAVVSFASGCGATLKEYALHEATSGLKDFSGKVQDISQFLSALTWPADVSLKPLRARVCLHTPCTLRNVLKGEPYPLRLLAKIEELAVLALPSAGQCCGAAGNYMFEHPAMAQALRADVLEPVAAFDPDYLLTSNIGCALHLRAGLRARKLAHVQVMHPIALLDQCLNG
jgi:glycolate oxidase iron-sulfur subunit